jgi:L-threonylcarbamoyladenylate synthase
LITRTFPIDTPARFVEALGIATTLLQGDQVVALPTETVYGLAGNALSAVAVERIFEIKGRPAHNPLIVHVAAWEQVHQCVAHWPDVGTKLAQAFWPGPLTLVVPKSNEVPDVTTGGGDTVAVRWPFHPFMQSVIRACNFPIAAPSANLSNRLSPTFAAHVQKQLDGRVPLIVDGGASNVGIESTVVDLVGGRARILRPGIIHRESLEAVVGTVDIGDSEANEGATLRSPGQLSKHYSPEARLVVWAWDDADDLAKQLDCFAGKYRSVHVLAHTHLPEMEHYTRVCLVPHDPEAYARAIYSELHQCDEEGADLIIVEAVPNESVWGGIRDRLIRASSRG